MKIVPEMLENVLTYDEYISLIGKLLAENKTTGSNHSETMLDYTKLNLQRIQRWEKTGQLNEPTRAALREINRPMTWITITEAWCGDASQIITMIDKMARENPLIRHRIILRDEHTDIMDHFLTNGTRSIPIVVFIDGESSEVLGHWGPRPKDAQQIALDFKANPAKTKEDFHRELHTWYARNKGEQLQDEFTALLQHLPVLS